MKYLKLTALALIIVAALFAGYLQFSPDNEAHELSHDEPQRHLFLAFAEAGDAFIAVGEYGQIWRSTDQGRSWSAGTSGTDVLLTGVAFPSALEGWAVGHLGTVLQTTDGGENWTRVSLGIDRPEEFTALDVAFADEEEGYIVGGHGRVFQTRDGGKTWQEDSPERTNVHLNAITILPSGRVLVLAHNGSIYSRLLGDNNWNELAKPTYLPLYGALSTDDQDGVLLYGATGTIFQSNDGGQSWQPQRSLSKADYFAGIKTSDGSLVLAGEQGVMVRRKPEQDGFYLEATQPVEAVLGLAEASDGTLLIAGLQGLGYLAGNEYRFIGDALGPTGFLRSIQLKHLPETRHLLAHGSEQSYYAEPSTEVNQQWIQVDVVSKNGTSLLSPDVFPEIRHLYLRLDLSQRSDTLSLWSADLLSMPVLRDNRWLHPMDHAKRDGYDEAEALALAQRLRRVAVEDVFIDRDHKRITYYLDLKGNDPVFQHFAVEYLEELRAELNQYPDSAYEIKPLQILNLANAPASAAEASDAVNKGASYVYVLRLTEADYGYCDISELSVTAQQLDPALRSVKGVQTSLSLAEIDKWNGVQHHLNWKWFSSGLKPYGPFSSDHENWSGRSCITTLAIVYGQEGAADVSHELRKVVETMATPEIAAGITVTPYLLTLDTLAVEALKEL